MNKEEIAESIVAGLNQLINRTSSIAKISPSYDRMQVEIVMEHLRKIESVTEQADSADAKKNLKCCHGYVVDRSEMICVKCGHKTRR